MRKTDCSYTILFVLMFLSATVFIALGLSIQQHSSSLQNITKIDANITKTDFYLQKTWVVVLEYNFFAQNNTYSGLDYRNFYTLDAVKEFISHKNVTVFYYKSKPNINGFAYFLDLSGWIAAIVIFSILSFLGLIVCCLSGFCLINNIYKDCLCSSKKVTPSLSCDKPIA